jgi:hypothetical protein
LILGTEVTYRTVKWETKLEASSYLSNQETVEEIARHQLNLSFIRLMKSRWQAMLLTILQHNSELELHLRISVGGGFGRNVIQTNSMLLLLTGGVNGTRERYMGSEDIQYNAELVGGITFQAFRFDHPRLTSNVSLNVFPSITDFGRIRLEFVGRVRYELFSDFYITLRVPYHFDSRPGGGDGDVTTNDYGIEATLSYSFR